MGCPAKSEVKAGACSALIQNRPLASEIIRATQEGAGGRLPVSVKTRLGFSTVDLSWTEFLLEHNLSMLTMHCRTRKEMSKVPAHWEYLKDIVQLRDRIAPDTRIVANGDIENRAQGLQLAEQYGVDGIMIGRGVFHDPYTFAQASPWEQLGREQRLEMYRNHVHLFADTWQAGERNIKTLNKFCKIYVNGFDGAKELREQLMAANSTDELLHILAAQTAEKVLET
jgi:tRNA-dihydrouridine synthase